MSEVPHPRTPTLIRDLIHTHIMTTVATLAGPTIGRARILASRPIIYTARAKSCFRIIPIQLCCLSSTRHSRIRTRVRIARHCSSPMWRKSVIYASMQRAKRSRISHLIRKTITTTRMVTQLTTPTQALSSATPCAFCLLRSRSTIPTCTPTL